MKKKIDATRAAFTTFGAGVVKDNPRKCIACGRTIKRGEAWRKDTSAQDPTFGRYTVIQHAHCTGNQ
jgi:hypothetical protein